MADREGPRNIMLFSLVVATIGTLPFAFANGTTSPILLAVTLLVRGAGMGGIFIVAMSFAYSGLNKDQVPHASTATRIFQTIGGAFGSAILATVIAQRQVSGHVSDQVVANAYNAAFWWAIALTVVAMIPALILPMHKRAK